MFRWGFRWTCLTDQCGAMGMRELVLSFRKCYTRPMVARRGEIVGVETSYAGDYLERVRNPIADDWQRHSEMQGA